ncbi:hypothetical protein EMPG_14796 [Blastomyces silverae]|uniref:Uncharacterized protein n=1 Tax=Blastomyces silverae TaxID=2060906 RepID=A0A0H1BF54_9EURO|nr:hypothetical protein EMPG_14796 [Blastomyces silverae]
MEQRRSVQPEEQKRELETIIQRSVRTVGGGRAAKDNGRLFAIAIPMSISMSVVNDNEGRNDNDEDDDDDDS